MPSDDIDILLISIFARAHCEPREGGQLTAAPRDTVRAYIGAMVLPPEHVKDRP